MISSTGKGRFGIPLFEQLKNVLTLLSLVTETNGEETKRKVLTEEHLLYLDSFRVPVSGNNQFLVEKQK